MAHIHTADGKEEDYKNFFFLVRLATCECYWGLDMSSRAAVCHVCLCVVHINANRLQGVWRSIGG